MTKFQFNVIFWVAVTATVIFAASPVIPGIKGLTENPVAFTGIGTMLAYVLTQKKNYVKDDKSEEGTTPDE